MTLRPLCTLGLRSNFTGMHGNYPFMHALSTGLCMIPVKKAVAFRAMVSRLGYGQIIRDARRDRRMTQKALAAKLRTSESTISNLEREQHPPTVPDQVNDLVLALGLSPVTLLSAMGLRFASGEAAGLPQSLLKILVQLGPHGLEAVEETARGQLALQILGGDMP